MYGEQKVCAYRSSLLYTSTLEVAKPNIPQINALVLFLRRAICKDVTTNRKLGNAVKDVSGILKYMIKASNNKVKQLFK